MPGPLSFNPLRDGFATLITFALKPNIRLYERETTPPGIDGGGPIESTHMRRKKWRSKDPKTLLTLGDLTGTVMYDALAYPDIIALGNSPGYIKLLWPDLSALVFMGYLDKFTPGGNSEGNLVTATYTIVPTLNGLVQETSGRGASDEFAPVFYPRPTGLTGPGF